MASTGGTGPLGGHAKINLAEFLISVNQPDILAQDNKAELQTRVLDEYHKPYLNLDSTLSGVSAVI